MSLTDHLGVPVDDGHDEGDFLPGATCNRSVPLQEPEPAQARRVPIIIVGAAALIVGAIAGWLLVVRPANEPSPPQAPAESSQMPVSVASTAELFTTLHLTGGTDLAALFAGESPAPTGTWVNQSAAIDGVLVKDGTWAVTVAVDSLEHRDDEYLPAGLAFYVVPIVTISGRPVAAGIPARVAAPAGHAVYDAFDSVVAAEQESTIDAFLTEWLTGGDDTTRYLATVNSVGLFANPPYVSVVVDVGGSDQEGRIVANVIGTTPHGAVHHLEYVVSLLLEDGVWEVTAVGTRSE